MNILLSRPAAVEGLRQPCEKYLDIVRNFNQR
jgi:hypothetical protein